MMLRWMLHAAIGGAAAASFALDDSPALSWFPYTHAAWHCLAAAGIVTTVPFILQVDGGGHAQAPSCEVRVVG